MGNSAITTIDWEPLREEGLEHLQAISGHLWTDYNIHDPGVTLLELLCYAITDLDQRLSMNIADLVTENTATTTTEHYFSPGSILTVNPVTINDYRKLLIDLSGVKNAWLEPVNGSEPALYYDQDNNVLLYDYATGTQRLSLNGLYRVYIETEQDVIDKVALKEAVLKKLHSHRNLSEDFVEVNIMKTETISVFSDIQITETADANEVMAQIYYDLANAISPRVRQYSIKRMLQKGKTIEEIFTGPLLENGFIDDAELGDGAKIKELHTSDLIRVIMANPEVKDVRNLFIANKPNPGIRDKQEWALVADVTKALALEPFNASKLRLFKNETICPVSSTTVLAKVALLEAAAAWEIYDDPAMDLSETLGKMPGELTDYESIAYQLPANYGVSETGLSSMATDVRRGQARQLRAYLLFFEQILVNYLKQLDSFKRLFAFRQDREQLLKSYFTRLLPEDIWREDFPEIESQVVKDPTESLPFCVTAFSRKNRILDHLLAQFNERFADYALFGYKYNLLDPLKPNDRDKNYLKAKADFLENYPKLSRDRNRAFNYWTGLATGQPTDGLKNLIASKLGINLTAAIDSASTNSEAFFIIEHILFRPRETVLLDFICSEKIDEAYQPDPYSYRVTFVIPKKAGRFGDSKFKDLVYTTIANETPAHISYTVLEFNSVQMNTFTECYRNYLQELAKWQQGKSTLYNGYRKQLMELLGIGEPKLPVLLLDASQVSGDGTIPTHGEGVGRWADLSGNDHHALLQTEDHQPQYWQPEAGVLPWLRFNGKSGLIIDNALFKNNFSIVVIFRTFKPQNAEMFFPLIAGADATNTSFTLGFYGNGDVRAELGSAAVCLESKTISPHLALFIYDSSAKEFSLTLDGALELTQTITPKFTLDHQTVTLGRGASCDLGEVIILDSLLTGSKKSKLEEYLAQKWSIPLSAVSSIAQPVLHLDANIAGSIIKNDQTGKVSKWQDVSLEQSSATQTTAASQPVFSLEGIGQLPALNFSNNALILPNPKHKFFKTEFTMALVYQADRGGTRLFDGMADDPEQGGFAITLGAKGALTVQAGTESVKLTAPLAAAHIAIVNGRINADGNLEISIGLDGQAEVTEEFSDPKIFSNCSANLVIGRSRNGDSGFTGKIGEIVIYDQALSLWERQRLEGFLAKKWRIDISGVANVAVPALHLDASRQASVLDETGAVRERITTVYRWLDRGDEGHHAVQTNPVRRPGYAVAGINGLGAIEFTQKPKDDTDYYDDMLNIDRVVQKDFTMLLVFQPDVAYYGERNIPATLSRNSVWTEGVALLDADCSGHYNDFGLAFAKTGSKLVILAGIGDRITSDYTIQSGELDFSNPHFVTLTREQASGLVTLYTDGRFQAQADLRDGVTLNDAKTIKIGAFNSGDGLAFHGMIGEVIIFDQVLTDSKRQRIEAYLAAKWRIPVVTLPLDTTGLSLHLDAADPDSVTRDREQRISQWADQNSQNEIAALQPVAEYQPVYLARGSSGLPAIGFNDSLMMVAPAFTSYQDLTLALVYTAFSTGNRYPGWEGGVGLMDHYAAGESGNFGVVINRNGNLGMRIGAQQVEAACAFNAPHIAIATRSKTAGAAKLYLDGLLAASGDGAPETALNDLDDWCIGAVRPLSGETVSQGYFQGELSEVLLFNRELTPVERQSLEAYFAAKWRIDLSGIKSIATPALHLDAAMLSTVITDGGGKVAQWLDRNGRNNNAVQSVLTRQPEYRPDVYRELGAIHFDRSRKTCLVLGPTVADDFAIFIVYRAEPSDPSDYMPVAPDSFTVIAGVDPALSAQIWTHFKNKGYLDAEGKVLTTFTPGADQFDPDLDAAILQPIQSEFERDIAAILTEYYNLNTIVPEIVFTAIGGVDAELSASIWRYLYGANYLNSDGLVLDAKFTTQTGPQFRAIIAAVVVNVVLTQNWLKGAGLFDGNCAGAPGQLNKRDFGLLVGKDGQLLAGIGVPDEGDYQLARTAAFNQWHLGVLTRVKNTGVTRLYLDGAAPAATRVAREVSLKDAKRFTIGAENNGGNYFNGDIGEIVVLDTVPDDNQIAAIQNYLAHKWGVIQGTVH